LTLVLPFPYNRAGARGSMQMKPDYGRIENPRVHPDGPIVDIPSLLRWDLDLHDIDNSKYIATTKYIDSVTRIEVWYRGVTNAAFQLEPSIYWMCPTHGTDPTTMESKRLDYEREVMAAFERELPRFMKHDDEQELYFAARHHEIPSRLLDWSTNPLVALFMALFENKTDKTSTSTEADHTKNHTGPIIYAMEPIGHLKTDELYNQYDKTVERQIKLVTEYKDPPAEVPQILPIRPHTKPGRIERQNSRFTLHCFRARSVKHGGRPTLRRAAVRVTEDERQRILSQLSRLNINQMTVFNTIDRLSAEIKSQYVFRP
jgi:hypothetical protein